MTSPASPPGGGELFLDTELARVAVDQLHKVYDGLARLQQRALDLARRPDTAHDPVSAEAFELLRLRATGPPGSGSFTAAVEAGMKQVEKLIQQMEADVKRQREADADGQEDIGRV